MLSKRIKENVIAITWGGLGSDELFEEERSKEIVASGGASISIEEIDLSPELRQLTSVTSEIWKKPTYFMVEKTQVFDVNFYKPPPSSWVLTLSPME